jgi:hypothetical protein
MDWRMEDAAAQPFPLYYYDVSIGGGMGSRADDERQAECTWDDDEGISVLPPCVD